MVAIVRPNFHHTMADAIYEKIQNRSANYYYFIGQVLSWEDEGDIDQAPTPNNRYSDELSVRNNIVGVKGVTINNVSFITRRIDWTSGVVYSRFDDRYFANDGAMNQIDYYVVTDDFNVYKCIDNNSGAASTIEPTGTDPGYTTTADGYIWKFMYFIPLSLRNKFMTNDYMPVIKKVKNEYYEAGTITGYILNDGGQDYDHDQTYAVITGDGADGAADLVIENGVVTGVTITNAGTGYTQAYLTVTKGLLDPGTGADIDLTLSTPGDLDSLQADVEALTVDGEISTIVITNSTAGYTAPPTITITGDGTGATAVATIDVNGEVESITMTNRGSGYTFANVAIAAENLGTTTARAIMSPLGGHGFDAPRELMADTLCFYVSFESETNQGLSVNNEYRQFGLVKDFDQYGAVRKFINSAGSACFKLEGTFLGDSYPEDTLIHTANNAKVMRVITSEDNAILAIPTNGTVPVATDEFFNVAESASFTVTTVTEPDLDVLSGEVLYIDNRLAFTSSEEQTVTFRTFIKF